MLVVKIGGAAGTELDNLVLDLVGRKEVIIVHGGSDEMNRLSEEMGRPPKFITSPSGHVSRVTDEGTLDLLRMAYSGLVNKRLVEMLRRNGVNAIGLTGIDGGLLKGTRKKAVRYKENGRIKILRDDNTGVVEQVNTELLKLLMDAGYVPVVTIPIESEESTSLNADGDRVAAAVASSMNAEQLVLLTNQPGLLRNLDDRSSLITKVSSSGIEEAMEIAQGRMKKKVLASREALQGGVSRIVIGDANARMPLSGALEGRGTVIC